MENHCNKTGGQGNGHTAQGVCAKCGAAADPEAAVQAVSRIEDINVFSLAEFYKMLADPTRLNIINALYDREMNVCSLAAAVQLTHSATSHALRILKQSRIVSYRKEGKEVYYRLADNHINTLMDIAIEHLKEKGY